MRHQAALTSGWLRSLLSLHPKFRRKTAFKRKQMNRGLREKDWCIVGLEDCDRQTENKARKARSGLPGSSEDAAFVAARRGDKDWPSFFCTGTSIADGQIFFFLPSKHHKLAQGLPFRLPRLHEEAPEMTQCSRLYRESAANQHPRIVPPLQCRRIYCVIVCNVYPSQETKCMWL